LLGTPKPVRKNRRKSTIARRRQSIHRRIFGSLAVALALATIPAMGVALIFGHDLMTQCAYFRAEAIEVQGMQMLTAAQVRDRAEIHPGDNVLAVNLETARKRLVAHPWVADAEIRRELPRRILIRIYEHRPLAVFEVDNRRFLVNAEKRIFKDAGPEEGRGLPVVTGLGFTDIPLADETASPAYRAATALLDRHDRAPSTHPAPIRRIQVDRETGITLTAGGPVPSIRIGYGNYPIKFQRLQRVLAYLKQQVPAGELASIDLTDINRIVITPRVKEAPPATGQKREV
jgi:cell division protein FtsQ